VAPSRWRGREPKTTITHEYNDDGRLVRSVVSRETEWLESDRAEALALGLEDAARCGGCGQPVDESMDEDSEGSYQAKAYSCHACAARDAKAPDYADQNGIYFKVVRKT
jgi:hypothetical protein